MREELKLSVLGELLKQKIVLVIAGGVLLLAVVPSLYFYAKYRDAQKQLADPTRYAQEEIRLLVDRVGKLIELPEGELPTIANVSDASKLTDQPFFASAQNGDKVLIYTDTKKAFLYRPGANKIIQVAPVNIGDQASASGQLGQTPAPAPLRFVLLNGTTVVGLTKKFESKLLIAVPEAVIADRDNARKRDYATSMLVDMTGKKAKEARDIGTKLGINVASFPQGEATVSADFVILLGEDQK
ncbi:MAG: hypothetical protein AAB557_03500 [Patescibacteria group bacterium]